MKITKEEYEKAKSVVKQYEDDERNENIREAISREKKLKEIEDKCDHHFLPTNAKWQSANQMQCAFCGKVIN